MSIKANELRIGNATDKGIIVNLLESGVHVGRGKCFTYNEINPIPLTPEILEKAGFVKDNTSQYGGYCIGVGEGEQIRIINDKNIGWHWPMNGYCRPKTTYLHQLQNLYFALTGEELIVKF